MKFHITFEYPSNEREKIINFLHGDGLQTDGNFKIAGVWIALQTGLAYALIEASNAKQVYQLCSRWSEYGQLSVTPVIDAKEI